MPQKKHSRPSAAALFAFTNALQPVKRAWVQAATLMLADFGLPTSLTTALILVSRQGGKGIMQAELAEEVGVNPGGMVRILDQAESVGLLIRRDSSEDRRVKTVHVLPKGRELASRMEEAIAELRATLLGDLPAEDIEGATRLLRSFESRISEHLQRKRADR